MDGQGFENGGVEGSRGPRRRFTRAYNQRCACRKCGAHAICVAFSTGLSGYCSVCGGADLEPVLDRRIGSR